MAACSNANEFVYMRRELAPRHALIAEVVRSHWQVLLARAQRIAHDADDAADLLQDALERALRVEADWAGPAVVPWLVTVMRHLFIDRCRQRRVRSTQLRLLEMSYEGAERMADSDEEVPTSGRITDETLRDAIEKLDEPFRCVFELHARRWSLSEIGRALGIPVSTVGTRLFRARRKLRNLLYERV
jgi:RNA polymerase sigma-70 factor (ECF subfamily)